MGVSFIIGDVTTLQADAVVNVINFEMEDGGSVNHAIHAAAGTGLKEYCEMAGRCPVGGVKLTPAFNLPARYIIHTVAPLWRDGKEQEEKWLAACYQRSLELAVKYNCRKVAIPVFSGGYSDFPFGKALQVTYDTCRYCLTEKNMPVGYSTLCVAYRLNRRTYRTKKILFPRIPSRRSCCVTWTQKE